MKTLRGLFVALILLCSTGTAMPQDVIVKKDQSTVMSKVLEITSTEIKYKKWSNQDGPTYSISRTDVVSINYENGEVENFTETRYDKHSNNVPQVQYLNSYMTKTGSSLFLNGRRLSDNEVQNLVSPEDYQLYLKGGNQAFTGTIFEVVGGLSGVVAVAIRLFSKDFKNTGLSVINTTGFKTYLAFAIVGATAFSTGIIISSIGNENIGKVVEKYNKKQGNAYSLNISPSLMQCEIPQLQSNYGLGLTLSMNF